MRKGRQRMDPTEKNKSHSDNIVYTAYAVVVDDYADARDSSCYWPTNITFTKSLEVARKAAQDMLTRNPDRSVIVFEVNPILRIAGEKVMKLTEQEIQPKETWRTD